MVEVAMPPVVTVPSDEVDDDSTAFQVLNHDNLPITIIGQAILKPFTTNETRQKGIVYPTRRIDSNLETNKQKQFAKSSDYIESNSNNTHEKNDENLKKQVSISHGQLNRNSASATKFKPEDIQTQTTFAKILDVKLRKLLGRDKKPTSKKNADAQNKKPLFVTTVKKGTFLEPPPEKSNLIGLKVDRPVSEEEKKLYAYSSEPRVLNRNLSKNAHKARCEFAAKAAGTLIETQSSDEVAKDDSESRKIADAPLPYANLMFDRRIVRGSNFAPSNLGHAGDGESAAARAAEARRRAMARRKARNQHQKVALLRLKSPPPVAGRKHEPVQTDRYLEEIWTNPPVDDANTQTDLFLERPISPMYIPKKTGEDAATQIYPGDLFDFDLEVQPILEVLVGKTIEQSLIEVLEEEELAALREQQRRYLEQRDSEIAEAQRIEERERRLVAEKDARLLEFEEGARLQREAEERIAAAVLVQGYMADLLPSVLEGLEAEGFLTDNMKQDIEESFFPWLMKEVTQEMQEVVSSRDLLSDIVREILENRAEIYKALNRETPVKEGDEEGPTIEDLALQDHLKLQQEIASKNEQEEPPAV